MRASRKVSWIPRLSTAGPDESSGGAYLRGPAELLPDAAEQDREMARLRIAVGNVEAVRPDRVRALGAAVTDGRYRPDTDAVARAVLRDVLGHLLA